MKSRIKVTRRSMTEIEMPPDRESKSSSRNNLIDILFAHSQQIKLFVVINACMKYDSGI